MALINKQSVYYVDYDHDNRVHLHNWGETAISNMRDWTNEDSYLIEFKRGDVFEEFDLTEIIPADTLADIRDHNSNTYLIMANSHEGFTSAVAHIYVYVCQRQKIPIEKTILISGGYDVARHVQEYAEQYDLPVMKAEWIVSFEGSYHNRAQYFLGWNANEQYISHGIGHALQEGDEGYLIGKPWPITNHKPPYEKAFVNFNRRWRPHRPCLVGLMSARGMLDKGFVSLGVGDDPRCWQSEMSHLAGFLEAYPPAHNSFTAHEQQLLQLPDLYLDTQDLVTNRAEFELDTVYYYENSLFSLVNETNYFCGNDSYEDMVFLSEKFFKPIMMRHPFLIVSTPGIYSAIHALGYKTFPEFIPEHFDHTQNDAERMWQILDIVEDVCSWSDAKQQEFVEYAKPICEHNWQTLWFKTQFTHRMNY